MPGFTSFLLGHTHPPSSRPTTPPHPESDSDSEPEIVRKLLRRKARREARQVTTTYAMSMRRNDVDFIQSALLRLKKDVESQIEIFHDAGISNPTARTRIMQEFAQANSGILHDGAAILQHLQVRTGSVGDLQAGLTKLGRITLMLRASEKVLSWECAGEIVGVYCRVLKSLGEMVGVFGRTRWRD